MGTPGKGWSHVTINTHASWLPGDVRGFRSRGHRIHSSGDYRNPPPPDEHAGLRRYQRATEPVRFAVDIRRVIAMKLVEVVRKREHAVLVVAVGELHAHLLVQLPHEKTKAEVGRIKGMTSQTLTRVLPGELWSEGCDLRTIRSRAQQLRTCHYILDHWQEGVCVWTYVDGIYFDPAPAPPTSTPGSAARGGARIGREVRLKPGPRRAEDPAWTRRGAGAGVLRSTHGNCIQEDDAEQRTYGPGGGES